MTIRCAVCGRENDQSSKFCIDCGKPIAPSGAVSAALGETIGGVQHPDPAKRFGVPPTRVSNSINAGKGAAPASPASPVPPVPPVAAGGAPRPPAVPPIGPAGSANTPRNPIRAVNSVPPGTAPCPYCGTAVDPSLPFCPKCGGRIAKAPAAQAPSRAVCGGCGTPVVPEVDVFCARCGTRVSMTAAPPTPAVGTAVFSASSAGVGPRLSLLDASGNVKKVETLPGPESTLGRAEGELRFPDDTFMSPVHAQLSLRDGQLFVRDLGSRNGTWLFTDAPYKLQDGDTVLVGSQLLRFRRLGYPGPHPPEADATRRLGSATPSADIAVLQQLRADGSARDNCHLSPSRNVVIGRNEGDWIFPYDKTMSGRHAEVRSEDLEFIVIDLESRNGIAIAVRGERQVRPGQRILIGDQTLRVESV
ncbi:MAG: FHA domain-containing protein [Gemmatimonadaceae bacterium]|nr:FHA domain-containing protein [Gemmatimonadaceae bacterium]